MDWLYDFKLLAVAWTGLEKDALHIYVALIVFFLANRLFGWKVRDARALVPVFLVALANEIADLRYNMKIEGDPYVMSSVHDMVNTMLVPIMLVAIARWTKMFAPTQADPSSDET